MSATTTLAPSEAQRRAMAAPAPEPPPVTSATRRSSRRSAKICAVVVNSADIFPAGVSSLVMAQTADRVPDPARYARHLALAEIGPAGQQRLAEGSELV